MIPHKPEGEVVTMHGSPEQTDVFALHVKIVKKGDRHYCVSEWLPTPEELASLNAGGKLELWVMGRQPPVALVVPPAAERNDGGGEPTFK